MQPWPLAKRILFRFAVAFFVLINFPFPFYFIPSETLSSIFEKISDVPVQFAARVLHVSLGVRPDGSSDTTYNYVNLLCVFVISIIIAIIWSILDRRRLRYDKGWIVFRAYLRFALATAMLGYGIVKVIPTQFPTPTLDRLMQPFGDASPMGLLWTFMGASAAYTIFSGSAEILGGLLLTTRRTALLGALVSAGALVNVAMLNYAYDVPLKIYSTRLLLEAIVIALPDVPRLVDFFIRHRAVAPAPLPRLTQSRALEIGGIVLRTLVVAAVVWMTVKDTRETYKMIGSTARRSPLYGVWRVDDFQIDSRTIPPGSDPSRWWRVIFDRKFMMSVQLMNDSRIRTNVKPDEKSRTLTVSLRNEPQWGGRLSYAQPDPNSLIIDGVLGGKKVHALCHREPIPKFLLTTRGFHWINELPFNR